ncbi:hypothetical protein [Mycobacterium asiaticum]|uniref:Uncharacterized protein n=1 Tax=Mycobacterium asiaticum TaxID=1790 RepID=A0A1A3L139_MYCAS|nr:hypothetical protein [Mycobacterium asiaticum]OBJ89896.1 hypothetical protein A5640_25150 [Mycobacterium asiaticum]
MTAMDRLRRVLGHRLSVAALIELALWLAVPYLTIGFVWAVLHTAQVERIEARLSVVMPTGADIAAFGLTTAFWPASIPIADACPAP